MGEYERLPAVGVGALTRWCPPELVDAVVDKCHRREHWVRLLPARTMVYFELTRCLFPTEGYARVYEHLLPLSGTVPDPAPAGYRVPNKSSLCKARASLGPEVLELLFHEVAGPLATPETCPQGFWRGLRVLSFDGALLQVADTGENTAAFGRRTAEGVPAAYPQARVVPLIECATHAVVDAAVGGWNTSETTLARQLAPATGPGTLVLADAGMPGVRLWQAFTTTGAELLWRLDSAEASRVERELPDGSYLARIHLSHLDRDRSDPQDWVVPPPRAVLMRVIEYRVEGSERPVRLGTTLLDPDAAPAAELAGLYPRRWESEGQLAETKAAQLGTETVLRSATPRGVRQEIWAQLVVHQLTRTLMQHAADRADPPLDPARLSFRRAQTLTRNDLRPGLSPLRTAKPYRTGRRPAP